MKESLFTFFNLHICFKSSFSEAEKVISYFFRYLLVDFGLAEVYKVKKETLLGDTNSLAGKRKRPDEV